MFLSRMCRFPITLVLTIFVEMKWFAQGHNSYQFRLHANRSVIQLVDQNFVHKNRSFCLTIAKNSNTSPLFKLLSFTNISNMQSKNSKYLPPQSLACEVYRKQANEVKDLLPQSHRTRKINDNMHKTKYKIFCCSQSSAKSRIKRKKSR